MFEIDDTFLTNVGYDVNALSDERKGELKAGYSADLSKRILARLADELTDDEAGEFSDIQEYPERALRWLKEFHQDFKERKDYQQVLASLGSETEANAYYAGVLWMGYAVPKFGEVVQEELDGFQRDLMRKRQRANDLLAEIESEEV